MKFWILIWGVAFALTAVLLGAFAAHGLKGSLDSYSLGVFKTAVDYQMHHAIGLLIVGTLSAMEYFSTKFLKLSAIAFIIGIFIFSGSLYALALLHLKWLGAITPFGGLAFIVGWVLLLIAIVKKSGQSRVL
ncbi:DUF423 domain-containing protein [Aliikangiella sp. IMCC44359]|uniref:DUF423 domain-containing protein n=1 Tax=Aliikangiella sp. IMCC44359 TaxID=3459125 RepID=UPI00403B3089